MQKRYENSPKNLNSRNLSIGRFLSQLSLMSVQNIFQYMADTSTTKQDATYYKLG